MEGCPIGRGGVFPAGRKRRIIHNVEEHRHVWQYINQNPANLDDDEYFACRGVDCRLKGENDVLFKCSNGG